MALVKLMSEHLESLSTDKLMTLLNPDFNIGRTYFKEEGKQFMITHNYHLIYEVNSEEDNVDEWETFGFPVESVTLASIPPVFGPSVRECLLSFFNKYPKLILYSIENPENYS
jgi:hypothetical protein